MGGTSRQPCHQTAHQGAEEEGHFLIAEMNQRDTHQKADEKGNETFQGAAAYHNGKACAVDRVA